jgi:hypothetical protein
MDKITQKRINRNNRHRGGNFEKRGADLLDMDVVPYSGSNARFGYGDVRDSIWLGEFKNITPTNGKVTIDDKWFRKNFERASNINHLPFLAWMPAGKSNKYIILDCNTFSKFQYTVTDSVELPKKSYNTKNLIIEVDARYMKTLKTDRGVVAIKLQGSNEVWYMMTMELFKILIDSHGLKGTRSTI